MADRLGASLERAKSGSLSEVEIEEIRSRLDYAARDGDDVYTLLHILGRAGDAERDLERVIAVADFDNPNADDQLQSLALKITGHWWVVDSVFPRTSELAFGHPSPFVRSAAAKSLGLLGRSHPGLRSRAATLLLEGFVEDPVSDQEVWEAFCEGLFELAGVPAAKRPYRASGLQRDDVDPSVLDFARECAGSG